MPNEPTHGAIEMLIVKTLMKVQLVTEMSRLMAMQENDAPRWAIKGSEAVVNQLNKQLELLK